MRTTIEIKDELRATLLHLAARRGMKGFSAIVAEAIEKYLKTGGDDARKRRGALRLRGTLSGKEGARLRTVTAELRRSWRSS